MFVTRRQFAREAERHDSFELELSADIDRLRASLERDKVAIVLLVGVVVSLSFVVARITRALNP